MADEQQWQRGATEPWPGQRRLPVAEFMNAGLLMEINRRVLHPVGLALAVQVPDGPGDTALHGYIIETDDPAGVIFDTIDAGKAVSYQQRLSARRTARLRELGYIVQPDPDAEVTHT
jgi:hypothetical protein